MLFRSRRQHHVRQRARNEGGESGEKEVTGKPRTDLRGNLKEKMEKTPPTLVSALVTPADREKVERAQAFRRLDENWPQELESFAVMARIAYARYLAYVKAGFTEAQALMLCK